MRERKPSVSIRVMGLMAQAPEARNALAATIFEENPPYLNNPGAAEFVKLFNERAAKANLPDTVDRKSVV